VYVNQSHVIDLSFAYAEPYPTLIPLDAQPPDEVMHLHRLRQTDCHTDQSRDPRPYGQRGPLALLRVAFARLGLRCLEMARVCAPKRPENIS